jgi:hypothetical protein
VLQLRRRGDVIVAGAGDGDGRRPQHEPAVPPPFLLFSSSFLTPHSGGSRVQWPSPAIHRRPWWWAVLPARAGDLLLSFLYFLFTLPTSLASSRDPESAALTAWGRGGGVTVGPFAGARVHPRVSVPPSNGLAVTPSVPSPRRRPHGGGTSLLAAWVPSPARCPVDDRRWWRREVEDLVRLPSHAPISCSQI